MSVLDDNAMVESFCRAWDRLAEERVVFASHLKAVGTTFPTAKRPPVGG